MGTYFGEAGQESDSCPLDVGAAEDIDRDLRLGATYRVVTTDADGGDPTLAKYMAGVGVAFHNLSDGDRARWPSPNKLSEMLLVALGYSHKEHIKLNRDSARWNVIPNRRRLQAADGKGWGVR